MKVICIFQLFVIGKRDQDRWLSVAVLVIAIEIGNDYCKFRIPSFLLQRYMFRLHCPTDNGSCPHLFLRGNEIIQGRSLLARVGLLHEREFILFLNEEGRRRYLLMYLSPIRGLLLV